MPVVLGQMMLQCNLRYLDVQFGADNQLLLVATLF